MTETERRKLVFSCVCSAIILVNAASTACSQDEDAARLAFSRLDSKAIVAQLREYERKEYRRTIRYAVSSVLILSEKAEPVKEKFDVWCSNGRHYVETHDQKTDTRTVFAGSEFGQFRVDQQKDARAGAKLTSYQQPQDLEASLQTQKRGFGMRLPLILPLSGLQRESWADFFEEESRLKFTKGRGSPDDTLQLAFQSTKFSGSITLLSASNPIVIKISRSPTAVKFVTTTQRTLLPADPSDPMPRCERLEVVMRNSADGMEMMRAKFDYSQYRIEEAPEKAFKLSNYGLPDPVDAPAYSTRSHLWAWLLLAAAALISISLVLRWVIRRRAPLR